MREPAGDRPTGSRDVGRQWHNARRQRRQYTACPSPAGSHYDATGARDDCTGRNRELHSAVGGAGGTEPSRGPRTSRANSLIHLVRRRDGSTGPRTGDGQRLIATVHEARLPPTRGAVCLVGSSLG